MRDGRDDEHVPPSFKGDCREAVLGGVGNGTCAAARARPKVVGGVNLVGRSKGLIWRLRLLVEVIKASCAERRLVARGMERRVDVKREWAKGAV